MRYPIVFLLVAVFFAGCGEQSFRDDDFEKEIKTQNYLKVTDSFEKESLEYLNEYRFSAGLTRLKENENLKEAANYHAKYLTQNGLYTHYQSEDLKYYTGYSPKTRAGYAGYAGNGIYENIYAGDVGAKESVDILFSNIYHRLTFLSFEANEAGVASSHLSSYPYKRVYVYELASGDDFSPNEDKNVKIVVWPYENQKDVLPFFYEEDPDPLPWCGVSGYPISIQFNPYESDDIKLLSFNLYDESKRQIIDTDILDATTDPNDKFSEKQFALMPKKRLEWGSLYTVKAVYLQGEKSRITKEWSFRTKVLPKPNFTLEGEGEIFNVKSGIEYHFYLPPKNCNDKFDGFRYSVTSGVRVEQRMIDYNTIKIKATGRGVVKVYTQNGKNFTLKVG